MGNIDNKFLKQDPIIMDIRARPRVIQSATGTKDLQMVCCSAVCLLLM